MTSKSSKNTRTDKTRIKKEVQIDRENICRERLTVKFKGRKQFTKTKREETYKVQEKTREKQKDKYRLSIIQTTLKRRKKTMHSYYKEKTESH